MEWFADNVIDTVQMTMKDRVNLATDFIRNKVVMNISKAVVVGKNKFGRRKVIERSKPGEFPRADTTALMKSIFTGLDLVEHGVWQGFVGTPLDYGYILETSERLNRSFLKRTLDEERATVIRILSGPIK